MIWLLSLITYSHRFDSQNLNTWCWIRYRFLLFDFLTFIWMGKKCCAKAEKTWSDMQRERNWFFLTSMCLHQLYHCAIRNFPLLIKFTKYHVGWGFMLSGQISLFQMSSTILKRLIFWFHYFLIILSLPSPACLLPNTRKFQEICEIFRQLRFNSFLLHSRAEDKCLRCMLIAVLRFKANSSLHNPKLLRFFQKLWHRLAAFGNGHCWSAKPWIIGICVNNVGNVWDMWTSNSTLFTPQTVTSWMSWHA